MIRPRARPTICLLLSCFLGTAAALPAQNPLPKGQNPEAQKKQEPAPPAPLSKAGTEALVGRYSVAVHWVQKVVTLLSLNHWWHPAGSGMVLEALQDKDERIRAFGLEALLRSEQGLLPKVASKALIEELIGKQLRSKNEHFRGRVEKALARIAPSAGANGKREWAKWWREAKETWQPGAWEPQEQPKGDGRSTSAASQRAFDLYQYGLDMVLCIDSTGSMQPTIDAVAAALGEMVDILDGISPKMRVGIVHYKDHGELGDEGAELLQPFTKNIKEAKKSLDKLNAFGGGDAPEAVLGGLQVAYDRSMKWKKDANKIVVLIGDAPPHPGETDQAVAAARNARENPGGAAGRPVTGAKKPVKPILTSAIGVLAFGRGGGGGLPPPGGRPGKPRVPPKALPDFVEIAEAGGGVYVQILLRASSGRPSSSKERDRARAKGDTLANAGTRRVVEHILVLSFGDRFKREMREFTRIYYDYKDAQFFK